MNWSSFKYLTKQGLRNMGANRLMTLAGIGVLTACLILTGAAWLFTMNVDSLVDYLGSQNETIVYLDPEQTMANDLAVQDKILAIPGVSQAVYHSKQDVLDEYRSYMEEYASLWDEFENDNPFKANYSVVIDNLENLEGICHQLAAIPGVVEVSAAVEMTNVFITVQRTVTLAGYVLVALLAVVSCVVISNTIRLSVYARRREINIMKYVGATNGFIRWPFFVEGVGVGLTSAALASAVTLGAYYGILRAATGLTGFWLSLLANSLVPLGQVWYCVVLGFFLFGILLGGIGSVMSIRKHLNV